MIAIPTLKPPTLMPSFQHQALLELFRGRPALAPELLRDALKIPLPDYTQVSIASADLSDIRPTEYRADQVILLLRDAPVLGIVLEVQLGHDADKPYVWPAYAVNLRARIRCPVCLFVVTIEENIARWAGKPIDLGAGNRFTPRVLSLSDIPEVTDEKQALEDPELAVLSALAQANDPDTQKSVRCAVLAQTASAGLDPERSMLYCDLILNSLTEAAREALQAMNATKYEYQSEFARRYYGKGKTEGRAEGHAKGHAEGLMEGRAKGHAEGLMEGRAEGRVEGLMDGRAEGHVEGHAVGHAEGRVELVLKLLAMKYGTLSEAAADRVREAAAVCQLERIAVRVLTAETLDEVFGLACAQS